MKQEVPGERVRSLVWITSMRMEEDQNHMTEKILNLTLEIIFLLTGESFPPVKSGDHLSITVPPPHCLTTEVTSVKKILEVTNKMIDLLKREEQKHLEEHKDLYKDVMMENQPSLTSPDGSSNGNPPERCPHPLYSRDSTQEDHTIPHHHQVDGSSNGNPPERCPRPLYSRDSTQEDHTITHKGINQSDWNNAVKEEIKEEDDEVGVMEKFLEEHKDPFKNIMMEPFGDRNPPERCPRPLYSRDSTQEDHTIPHHHQVGGSSNGNPPERCPCPLYSRDSTQEDHTITHKGINQSDWNNAVKEEDDDDEEKFLEGHKDPFKTCPCPLYSRDSTQEDHTIPHHHQGEERINIKVKEEVVETYVGGDQPSMEEVGMIMKSEQEEMSPPINTNKMSAKRKSYSVEYKKAIVEDSQGKNLTAFCKEMKLDLRMVRKWRAEYGNLSQKVDEGNAKKRKCGSGRHPLIPELEDIICEWIADKRAKAVVVHRADIQAFALTLAPKFELSSEEFKASQHWLNGFLHRYDLSLKSNVNFGIEF
ncbi:uncharacterized protein [Aquarana catesbeiana]|uniref:uncharacterized protein n=1 Tax=Aquarana catesbeiana TaxID=8400 RepID=UPI003CC93010